MLSFDEFAALYDAWFMKNSNVLASELKLVAYFLKDTGRALSVGCGSGLFEKLLRTEYRIDILHGIEPSAGMAKIARQRGMDVTIETAEAADFGYELWDTILYNGTTGYIKDLKAAFEKSKRALKPGGKIIVIDIPKESSYGLLYNLAKTLGTWDHDMLHGIQPVDPYPIEFVREANWHTTAEKIALLEAAGFADLRFAQTLMRHPLYSDNAVEEPADGYDRGDYVAICGIKQEEV